MKTILSILVFAAIVAAASFTQPTNYQILGNADLIWSWKVLNATSPKYLDGYNPGTVKDTLKGTDTMTLLTKFPLDKNGFYAFQICDSAGAADSFRIEMSVWSADGYQSAWTVTDTIAGAAGVNVFKTVVIPSTLAYKPAKVSIRAIKWIATLVTKVRAIEVIKFDLGK